MIKSIEITTMAVGKPDWITNEATVHFTNPEGRSCIMSISGMTSDVLRKVRLAQDALAAKMPNSYIRNTVDIYDIESGTTVKEFPLV